MQTRRDFLQQGSQLVTMPLALAAQRAVPVDDVVVLPPAAKLARIGITSVCYRERFPATRTAGRPAPAGGNLTLTAFPSLVRTELGVRNIEVWNAQFENTSLEYCRELRAAANAVGANFINIQLDGPYDLSDPMPSRRVDSIAFVKGWMDRAAAIGASRLRANTGGQPGQPWVPATVIDSFRQLSTYGKQIGVKILVENHIGFSMDIDKVVEVVRGVNDPNCRALSDWGNTPAGSIQERVAGLRKMFPYLELVSAKQLAFDGNRHISYDVVPMIDATEASGFRGIYSIEFYDDRQPTDVTTAAKTLLQTIASHLRA